MVPTQYDGVRLLSECCEEREGARRRVYEARRLVVVIVICELSY